MNTPPVEFIMLGETIATDKIVPTMYSTERSAWSAVQGQTSQSPRPRSRSGAGLRTECGSH